MATEAVQTDVYTQIENHDWNNDPEFQSGLQSILGSASSSEQIERLTMRARCFYFSRKLGSKIDLDGYQAWRAQQTDKLGETSTTIMPTQQIKGSNMPLESAGQTALEPLPGPYGNASAPASFAEICQLIADGKPIPGIKDIPDTVLEGQATRSVVAKRRKPWEKDTTMASTTEAPESIAK